MDLNRRLPPIENSRFAMVPRADIPRSTFVTKHSHKTTFNASYLIPILCEEVLPGDVHHGELTIFARLANLIFPLMDTLELETFFFFVPDRLVWVNFTKMMGERTNPADSISFTTPQIVSPAGGFPIKGLYDYFGLPTVGQVAGGLTVSINALPIRAYCMIWDHWFRDENLQNGYNAANGDGPDTYSNYTLARRNKKADYFTSALPWPLKGGVDVSMPLSGTANVLGLAVGNATPTAGVPGANYRQADTSTPTGWAAYYSSATSSVVVRAATNLANASPVLYADLSSATGATINALRTAFQTQRLLERDARSGTRYTELLSAHYGVDNPDGRLQRPEYIGGGKTYFQTSAIPQTSATALTGSTTALGSLSAQAVANDQHTFTLRATEFGWIIGLACVRAELTYQQGLHRKWTRLTRYDRYWPVFANLGEQAIRYDEIYADGNTGSNTFGYQERWAEYRYRQSQITGLFRSTSADNIDEWHAAIQFGSQPLLNSTFIADDTVTVLQRVLAAGAAADGAQILFDSVFKITSTRPMPMFSVPGMIDHF